MHISSTPQRYRTSAHSIPDLLGRSLRGPDDLRTIDHRQATAFEYNPTVNEHRVNIMP